MDKTLIREPTHETHYIYYTGSYKQIQIICRHYYLLIILFDIYLNLKKHNSTDGTTAIV